MIEKLPLAESSSSPCAIEITASRCRSPVLSVGSSTSGGRRRRASMPRSEEHTSELQSLMRISYAVFCLKKKKQETHNITTNNNELHTHRDMLNDVRYMQTQNKQQS